MTVMAMTGPSAGTDARTHGGACEAKDERDCDRNKCHDEPSVSNENFQKLII